MFLVDVLLAAQSIAPVFKKFTNLRSNIEGTVQYYNKSKEKDIYVQYYVTVPC